MTTTDRMLLCIEKAPRKAHVFYPYSVVMELAECGDAPDWRRINEAIIERWSMRALIEIKQGAHGIAEAQPGVDALFSGGTA